MKIAKSSAGSLQVVFRIKISDGHCVSLISSILRVLKKVNYAIKWSYLLNHITDQTIFFRGTTNDLIPWKGPSVVSKRALLIGSNVEHLQQYLGPHFDAVYHESSDSKLQVLEALSLMAQDTKLGDALIVYFSEQESPKEDHSPKTGLSGDTHAPTSCQQDRVIVKYGDPSTTGWSLTESELLFCLSEQEGTTTVLLEEPVDALMGCCSSFPVQLASRCLKKSDKNERPSLVREGSSLKCLVKAASKISMEIEDLKLSRAASEQAVLNMSMELGDHELTRAQSEKASMNALPEFEDRRISRAASEKAARRRAGAKPSSNVAADIAEAISTKEDKHYGTHADVNIIVGPTKAFCWAYDPKSNLRKLIMGMRTHINHCSAGDVGDLAPSQLIPSFSSSRPIDAHTRLELTKGRTKRALFLLPNSSYEDDWKAMKIFLIERSGFEKEDIFILKGKECTREAILYAMKALQQKTRRRDHAFIYCQGTGSELFLTAYDGAPIYTEDVFETLVNPMTKSEKVTMFCDGRASLRLPYSVEADDELAVVYIPSKVISIRVQDTHSLLSGLREAYILKSWPALADASFSKRQHETSLKSWPALADSINAVVTSSRPLSHKYGSPIEIVVNENSSHHHKRAVLISSGEDPASVEKTDRFKLFLQQYHGFVETEICVLRRTQELTRGSIMKEFRNMRETVQQDGDSLVVYLCDDHATENNDAVFLPSDWKSAGPITGHDILHDLVEPLPQGVHLTVVMDTGREKMSVDLPLPFYYAGTGGIPDAKPKESLAHMLLHALSETMDSLAEEVSESSVQSWSDF